MRNAFRTLSFVLVLLTLAASAAPAVADTPASKAMRKGQRYTHRPYYKQYRHGKVWNLLFARKS
ncbi:hypothetical protein [Solirubrum puertoriconensis]|uniref:Uncharacterized protein n=1 Tax=Solirubrum puertoriconensis TaxID=1751427 RepID=A0A9X0HJ93_SOLP1|nr:hypothetical protein [Solirubrum puertoriconensis]KUG06869.1 hypothetical protein ASU33_05970 [Solirubrum puertoriconensis]